ncbi:MAG TPA: PaaI family thioesterase [Sphingomonas sp.]|jgi:uncharacterized protein (TIGR00369 family)
MDLPPYAALIGATLEAGGDEPILLMPYGEAVLGRPGFLHGGAIAGLMEMAAVAALARALDADGGGRIKPITVTVDYMRGGRDHDTRALGRVTRLGNRVANVEAVAWQEDRARHIAAARMNYLIVRD